MSVRILHDRQADQACLFCSTTDWAFGPIFSADDDHDADERAEAFCRWLEMTPTWKAYEKEPLIGNASRRDARQLTDAGLSVAFTDWLAQETEQWAREDAAEVS